MGRLNGKVAVVAGGGGIGGATARRLAAEGAAVVIGDLETGNAEAIAREIAASGDQALGIGLDISEEPSVAGLVEAAVSRFGGLDLMHADALMRHVASRWGRQGIRANAVAPGLVLTENNLRTMPEEVKKRALAHGRSTRLGTPDDIAATVVHLPSDDGAWINGQVISMDADSTLR